MALRGVWQLQKLVVNYCDWGGSSRGIRAFMESHLPALKEKNPQLEVVTQLVRGQHPNLKGIYIKRLRRLPEAPVHSGRLKHADNVKRGWGRPNLTWEESVKRDLKDWSITKELAMDRGAWKLAIHVPEP